MFFNFGRILAYFRRSCFCSRRLSIFKPGTKIQSDFCPRLIFYFLFSPKENTAIQPIPV
ncbi:hypothetical protein EY696_11050 [Enterococcus faecalis]|nr:hypothetical protein [Enterococcus faecalis]